MLQLPLLDLLRPAQWIPIVTVLYPYSIYCTVWLSALDCCDFWLLACFCDAIDRSEVVVDAVQLHSDSIYYTI